MDWGGAHDAQIGRGGEEEEEEDMAKTDKGAGRKPASSGNALLLRGSAAGGRSRNGVEGDECEGATQACGRDGSKSHFAQADTYPKRLRFEDVTLQEPVLMWMYNRWHPESRFFSTRLESSNRTFKRTPKHQEACLRRNKSEKIFGVFTPVC